MLNKRIPCLRVANNSHYQALAVTCRMVIVSLEEDLSRIPGEGKMLIMKSRTQETTKKTNLLPLFSGV